LADYRDHYGEIRASGADVVAVSVDPQEASEAVRWDLRLPFMILCEEWGIHNPRERGGIAKPDTQATTATMPP
jgi:peroxiredoxin